MKKLTIIILLPAILLCSCTHYYYVTNVQNIPLFKEKNEVHLSGSFSVGEESECLEVQAAYSLPYNIGIMANYMNARGGSISNNDYGKGNYFEGAIGYYKPFEKYGGVFEIYGGIGGSTQHHEYTSRHFDSWEYYKQYDGNCDLSFTKLFIQPSYGFTSDMFDIALSTRIYRLSFTNMVNNITVAQEAFEVSTLSDKGHYFIEPAITFRGGWKFIKVQLQAAYTGYLGNPGFPFNESIHFSAGAYFTISKKFKQDAPIP